MIAPDGLPAERDGPEPWRASKPDAWKDDQPPTPAGRATGRRAPTVLGGTTGTPEVQGLRAREPLLTLASAPRLFAAVLAGSGVAGVGVGLALWSTDPFWAALAGVAVVFSAFVGAFVHAQRKRMDPLRVHHVDPSGPH